MYTYNLTQWIAFFILYCFLGWCWETPYVSIKEKKWVNRGFMHGPFLPIYGSGALIVLMATLPLRKSVVLVYFAGLTAATVLEYVTGAAMEAMFKVRYWDYSNQKFNLHGHICLSSSIAWGFFSVGMVYGFHRPFERWITSMPDTVLLAIVDVLIIVIAADFAVSFKAAIELRDILIAIEKAKREARILQKRLDVIEAVLADEAQMRWARYEQQLEEKLAEMKQLSQERYEDLKENLDQLKEKYDQFEENYREISLEGKERLSEEFEELKARLEHMRQRMSVKHYMNRDVKALIKRNPSASSLRYKQSFAEFKTEVWPELKLEMKQRGDEIMDKMHVDQLVEKIHEEIEERKQQLEELLEDVREDFQSRRKK